MSNSSIHHTFDVLLAKELKDVNLAILIHNMQFWIMLNKRKNINHFEDRTWTYQTIKDIAACFPYWSTKQVERLLIKAVKFGIMQTGNFNKSKFDKTLWYAFVDEQRFSISRIEKMEEEIDFPKSGNGNPQIGTPIPDTKTNTEFNIKEVPRKKAAPSLPSSFLKRAELVFVSDEEQAKLVAAYGEEFVQRCYKALSEWKEDTPKSKWKKSDYRSILRWVVDKIRDEDLKGKRSASPILSAESAHENKKICQALENKLPYTDFVAGNTYAEFKYGAQAVVLKYDEKDFMIKFENELKNKKIKLKDLEIK